MRMRIVVTTGMLVLMVTAASGQQTKAIPIGVKVEAEGGTHSQGMWEQGAKDLTPRELQTIQSLVVNEIAKQNNVRIVPLDYSENFVGIVVVAAKLPREGKAWYYIASSAVIVATKTGNDELVTHDVVAANDPESLARSVGLEFASARLRAAIDLLGK
jgi:hypothetical protein